MPHSGCSALHEVNPNFLKKVMADFLKIVNTLNHCTAIKKLKSLDFSKKSLFLLPNYLSDKQQYIQVNDIKSS